MFVNEVRNGPFAALEGDLWAEGRGPQSCELRLGSKCMYEILKPAVRPLSFFGEGSGRYLGTFGCSLSSLCPRRPVVSSDNLQACQIRSAMMMFD